MVRHNNMIPNAHFHKKWQKLVRVRLDQPMRKRRRHFARLKKSKKLIPMPVDKLRPVVRCPTVRYHTKMRLGRGFSLMELKAAKINRREARTIGIAVDQRRRNKSMETLRANTSRLGLYINYHMVFKRVDNSSKMKREARQGGVICQFAERVKQNVLEREIPTSQSMFLTEQEKNFKAFETLRKARNEKRKMRKKLKRKEKENAFEVGK